jgi:hypothetical protein
MSARKRKKQKKNRKKIQISKKFVSYTIAVLIIAFLLYRIIVLLNFKVDCSRIPRDKLSTDNSIVNTLFVFEEEGKIANMELVTYSKTKKNILRVIIPTNIYVSEDEVDSYPISSMNSVGEFLEYNSGKNYTLEYMGDTLGLKFDNYVWIADSSKTTEEFLSKLSVWSILFDFKYTHELKGNLYSNLPIVNLIKEVNLINQILLSYQYENMDVAECCIKEIVISSDRKQLQFDTRSFDEEFSKYVKELVAREVEQERVNVEVYNASNISGLASAYARKVRHTGCRILRYDNAPNLYEKTQIYIPEPDGYQNSLLLIRDIVGSKVEVKYERPPFVTTGDIVLILGKDIADSF